VIGRAMSVMVLVAIPAVAACSGSSSYPDPGPCPTATALRVQTPSPGRPPGGSSTGLYTSTIRAGLDRISQLREAQRSAHPDDSFSRKPEFRTSFAAYADSTMCAAEAMKALTAPDQRYTEFDSNLEAALQALIEHTAAGRVAVGKRNTTDYHAWFKGVDAKIEALRLLYDGRPR
jgi:hypothetical protein